MVRKLIVIMVCLLLTVSIGCSKKSQYQFALDAVAAKPEFDKDKGHWAWQYSDFRGKRIPSLEYTSHWTFLLGALKGKIPTEGDVGRIRAKASFFRLLTRHPKWNSPPNS